VWPGKPYDADYVIAALEEDLYEGIIDLNYVRRILVSATNSLLMRSCQRVTQLRLAGVMLLHLGLVLLHPVARTLMQLTLAITNLGTMKLGLACRRQVKVRWIILEASVMEYFLVLEMIFELGTI
jgi:hypothetical protein